MCGIVGLLVKQPALRDQLGNWAAPILDCMGDRGADSAGLALFTDPLVETRRRMSLFAERPFERGEIRLGRSGFPAGGPHPNPLPGGEGTASTGFESYDAGWDTLRGQLAGELDPLANVSFCERHALVETAVSPPVVQAWLRQHAPGVRVLGAGRSLEIYKDIGSPRQLIERYKLKSARGTHVVGHTRMATESAVSVAHAHPFTAGEDFCLVHNGSLSNPHSIRRKLERRGIAFETDNDTEAACRYLQWRMAEGDTLERAIERGFDELDGFYTLLIGTADRLVLVRDPFACKPAVVAESDDYVAISSEYRALAHLPGIRQARVFEPAPEKIYSWPL